MELFVLLLLGLVVTCVAVPLRRYANAHRRGKPLWPETIVVGHAAVAGAYRSSVVREEVTIHAPPRIVEGVAMASSFLGMAWLPSLPIVGLGLIVEADSGVLGPALIFGLTGMALSIGIFSTGPKLLERRRVAAARFVAWWSILHNAAILVTMMIVSSGAMGSPSGLGEWQMYSLSTEFFAWLALAYVAGSFVHAAMMMRAVRAVAQPVAHDEEQEILDFAATVR